MTNSDFWYVASYPKSGNTWCRVFICELKRLSLDLENNLNDHFSLNKDINTGDSFSSRIWIDDQIGIESSDLKRGEIEKIRHLVGFSKRIYSEGYRYHKVHDAFYNKYNYENSTICTRGCKGAIYIIRNPFDICVSLSNFLNWEMQTCVDVLTNEDFWLNSSTKSASFHLSQFLGTWENHADSWLNQNKIPVLLIRYEDLIRNPFKYFSKIASFINIECKKEIILKAIENSSFSSLKSKEKMEGGFIESPFGCKEFFRKGIIGEGMSLLNKKQISQIKEKFKNSLKKFKYI